MPSNQVTQLYGTCKQVKQINNPPPTQLVTLLMQTPQLYARNAVRTRLSVAADECHAKYESYRLQPAPLRCNVLESSVSMLQRLQPPDMRCSRCAAGQPPTALKIQVVRPPMLSEPGGKSRMACAEHQSTCCLQTRASGCTLSQK
jgi:hypothetical protein